MTSRRPGDDERGVVVPLVAMALTALLVMVALAVDVGAVAATRRQAQAVADAAAIAGAHGFVGATGGQPVARAERAAVDYAERNLGVTLALSGTCPASLRCYEGGGWRLVVLVPYRSTRAGVTGEQVRVELCRQVGMTFGRVAGVNELASCATATAAVMPGGRGGNPPGVLVSGRPFDEQPGRKGTRRALHNRGWLEVRNGTIWVNSRNTREAARLERRSTTIATSVGVVGAVRSRTPLTLVGTLTTGVAPVPDPLDGLPAPAVPSTVPKDVKVSGGAVVVLTPGHYGKIEVRSGGRVVLQGPGVFTVHGIDIKDDTSVLESRSAMVFSTGPVRVDRGGELALSAMTVAQASAAGVREYADVALFMSRCPRASVGTPTCDEPSKKDGPKVTLKGKRKKHGPSQWRIDGAVYAPSSRIEIKGDSEVDDDEAPDDDDEDLPDDDEDPDEEFGMALSRSVIVAARVSIGKKASVTLDTTWPFFARSATRVQLVE